MLPYCILRQEIYCISRFISVISITPVKVLFRGYFRSFNFSKYFLLGYIIQPTPVFNKGGCLPRLVA